MIQNWKTFYKDIIELINETSSLKMNSNEFKTLSQNLRLS